jgi:hypothetical protein
LDDDVSAFFGTRAAPMLAVAVGVPAYRARPGMRPAQPPRIGVVTRCHVGTRWSQRPRQTGAPAAR